MNTLPLSKPYGAAYYGLLVAIAALTGYVFYLGVFQYLEIRSGGLRMIHTCYTDSSLAEAGYWCCFSLLLVVSAVGLWLRKRWAYFLFHVFGAPAVLLCLVYLGNALSEDIRPGWAGWLCALVGSTFIVLLNARRKPLFGPFGGGWKIVLVGLAGLVANVLMFILVSIV
jgi:hypothetical protein